MVKRLIYGSIRKNVISYTDFEYLSCEVNHLVNRRPISFVEALRDCSVDEELPTPITPEMLIRGHELISINIMPHLTCYQNDIDYVPGGSNKISNAYNKLSAIRKKMIDIYATEFIPNLIDQATDIKDRYKKVKHNELKIGDLVLLRETFCKPSNFPLAIVKKVTKNDLEEVTAVEVLKGKTKEIVSRHVTSIVPLLSVDKNSLVDNKQADGSCNEQSTAKHRSRPRRIAALKGDARNKGLASANLV